MPRMDSFLNLGADHREVFNTNTGKVPDARMLLDHYEGDLVKIGYTHYTDDRAVTNSNNTPLYHIVFGSKNPLGIKLKKAVSQKTVTGQFKLAGL